MNKLLKKLTPENCSLTTKFALKIIAPTQANPPQRVGRVKWGKLCNIYEQYCLRLKNHFTKKYFSGRQIRIKKWFTSIYCLQILTRSWRISLIRKHLSLNVSWFSYTRTQKILFSEKLIQKKIQENFIVSNSKIIRAWYLSSKWPVCRSIVNQTTGGTSRTKLSTLLKINIVKYCALFRNRVAKINLQWRNSFNSNNLFCTSSEHFPF